MSKFIFSILFLLCLTVAKMKCNKCDYMNKEGKCLNDEGICIPNFSQVCITKEVYQDGKFEYISQGCEKFCSSMTFIDNRKLVQFECCEDKPLCNIP